MAGNGNDDDAAGIRSPRYPAITLEEAVEKVRAIYAKDKTAGTPMQAVWGLMGYKSKSGPAATAIAALKRFGLVEVRNSRVYPSQRAVAIVCLPASDARRQAALREAATEPGMYRELLDRYRGSGLPSANSLQHELMLDNRFNHNAIPGLVSDFLETLKFAGLTDENGLLLPNDGDQAPPDEDNDHVPPEKHQPRRRQMSGMKEDVFSLDEGAVVLQWPERLSKTSAADLQDWLKLIGRKIKRAVGEVADDDAEDASDSDEDAE